MSDVTEAATQAEVADSLVSDEPEQQVAEQEPAAEQQTEVQEESQPVEQEQPETIEETAEEWLPTEQDKVFPNEVLTQYAQRYGLDEQSLTNPQLRQLVVDKINADIYIRQQQEQQPLTEEAEAEQIAEPTQEAAPLTREQYFQGLDRVIQERTDPEVAKAFHADFLRAFGVPEAEIAKTSPQQALSFTHTASKYMLNLVNTFIDDMLSARLSNHVSQAYPGFGEMYERSAYAMAWDRVRNSNPQFGNLPAYGTKDFSKTLRDAASRIPGFDQMQFTDGQGKALPMMENAMQKYSMLAQMASGQNIDPQLLQRAAAAQARNTRRAEVRRSAGNLGSGQSKAGSGSTGSSKFQSNTDLFDDETMEIYQREHGRL